MNSDNMSIVSRLSRRMATVCDMVTPGKRVADIGCDHAMVSIYLVKKGISPFVVAMDVREGPLNMAQYNISTYNLNDRIETRLSDGFDALNDDETDAAVIAGMGGALMIRLLENAGNVVKSGYELILQPQSEIHLVRRFMRENGYTITKEAMVYEEDKFYTIIKAIKNIDLKNAENEIKTDAILDKMYDEYGEYLIKNQDKVLYEYLLYKKGKYEHLSDILRKSGTKGAYDRLAEINEDMEILNEVLKMMK